MKNIDLIKKGSLMEYYFPEAKTEKDINKITAEEFADAIGHDCVICPCYGCLYWYNEGDVSKIRDKDHDYCKEYIVYYLNKEHDLNTDRCMCKACVENRGDKYQKHTYRISNGKTLETIMAYDPQEAKALAVKNDYFKPEEYTNLTYEIVNNKFKLLYTD